MIGCPVDGCPDEFVHAILLGRHLRRRHTFSEPAQVEMLLATGDTGGSDVDGSGEAVAVDGVVRHGSCADAGGGDACGSADEDRGSDDETSSVGTSDGESSESGRSAAGVASGGCNDVSVDDVRTRVDGVPVEEGECSTTRALGTAGSADPLDDMEDRALYELYSLAARHHPREVDIGAGDLGSSLCGQVWDHYNAVPCVSNPVYHPASFASSRTHVSAFRSPATRQFFFHACTSGGAGVSKGEVARLYRLCRRVEDGNGSTTRPIKDVFKSKTAIKEAVQKEKKGLLQLLGWMEADAPTVLGPQRIVFRSGMLEIMKAIASAPAIRWERGGEGCNCREGVRYDYATQCDAGNDEDETGGVQLGCPTCTPVVHEKDGPQLSPTQNDDVLRGRFD